MPRPSDVVRTPLAEAIRRIRHDSRQTQEEFARRLLVSVGSIARYETNARPSKRVLRHLEGIALSREMDHEAAIVHTSANIPTTSYSEQESKQYLLTRAFYHVLYEGDRRRLRQLEKVLRKEMDDIAAKDAALKEKVAQFEREFGHFVSRLSRQADDKKSGGDT